MSRVTGARSYQTDPPWGEIDTDKEEDSRSTLPSPIGVDRTYRAPTTPRSLSDMSITQAEYRESAYGTTTFGKPPSFYDGDEYAPANISPASIAQLQTDMARVGLIAPNRRITVGYWDETTATAFRQLLAYANQRGFSKWEQALSDMDALTEAGGLYKIDEAGNLVPIGEAARPPLISRTTDPESLRVMFREASVNALGMGLAPEELNSMVQAYNSLERQRQQEAYNAQLAGGSFVEIPSPEAFAASQFSTQHGEQKEEYEAMNYTAEALQLLASPAWGIGG